MEGRDIEALLRNPHAEMRIEFPGESGEAEIGRLEIDDPGDPADQRIVAGTLMQGDALVVDGNPARDGSTSMFVQRFVRPADGLEYYDD